MQISARHQLTLVIFLNGSKDCLCVLSWVECIIHCSTRASPQQPIVRFIREYKRHEAPHTTPSNAPRGRGGGGTFGQLTMRSNYPIPGANSPWLWSRMRPWLHNWLWSVFGVTFVVPVHCPSLRTSAITRGTYSGHICHNGYALISGGNLGTWACVW